MSPVSNEPSKVEFSFATAWGFIQDDAQGFCYTTGEDEDVLGTFSRDEWHHFTLRARWSADPAVGYIQVWMDGQERVPFRHQATLVEGTGRQQMLRFGIYESNNASNYHSSFRAFYDDLVIRQR